MPQLVVTDFAGLHWVGLLLSSLMVGAALRCPVGGVDLEGGGLFS